MTDSEIKKIFQSLSSKDNNLNEVEMAISLLVAVGIAQKTEAEKARTIPSQR